MLNPREIWRNSPRRARARFLGSAGIGALLITFAPVWDNPAKAAITDFDFGPSVGTAGTTVGFRAPECIDIGIQGVPDIALEINTAATNNPNTPADESTRDQQGFNFQADGTYGDDGAGDPAYIAPPEFDFLEPPASNEGPAYDVNILCFTADGGDEGTAPDLSTLSVNDGFTYLRVTTTSSSTSSSTTTTVPATTTSTAPASTTSTTVAATTTSTTIAGTTTSTTSGGGTTTSTTAGATTTSTTAPGATTTSSTLPPATLPPATLPPGATTTSSSTSTSTSTTATPGCTVDDTTPATGQSVAVSCGGFAGGASVTVDLLSDPVRLATLNANTQGVASGSVLIPLTTAGGSHTLRFTGTAPNGSTLVRNVAITVEKTLPRTGANTWNIFRVSLLLLGIGLVGVGRSQLMLARD